MLRKDKQDEEVTEKMNRRNNPTTRLLQNSQVSSSQAVSSSLSNRSPGQEENEDEEEEEEDVNRFRRNKQREVDPFEVEFEDSGSTSNLLQLSNPTLGRDGIFTKKAKLAKTTAFGVDCEESLNKMHTSSILASSRLDGNCLFKKHAPSKDFQVSFNQLSQEKGNDDEENTENEPSDEAAERESTSQDGLTVCNGSGQVGSVEEPEEPMSAQRDEEPRSSQGSLQSQATSNAYSQESVGHFKEPNLFQRKKHKVDPFNVTFDDSKNLSKAGIESTPSSKDPAAFGRRGAASGRTGGEGFLVDFDETCATGASDNASVAGGGASEVSDTEQSSFNDENLKEWMSYHTDGEGEPTRELPDRYRPQEEDKEEEEEHPDRYQPQEEGQEEEEEELPDRCQPQEEGQEEEEEDLGKRFQSMVEKAREKARKRGQVLAPRPPPNKSAPEKPRKPLERKYAPKLVKPARFVTKRLYDHLIRRLRPTFGIDSVLRAENLVLSISDAVKIVTRRKGHQKKLINDLKLEMAEAGVVETTVDFYNFVRDFLPDSFRDKVVPCVQLGTNIVFPPKDVKNPFDKIL